jgi:tetratricopeptide (TPR) repeat protein
VLALTVAWTAAASQVPPDAVGPALERLEAMRARIDETTLDGPARRGAVELLLAERAALIAARPDHAERPWWLVDQAEDLMLRRLPADGAGLTALLGLPTAEQRALAIDVAAQVAALTREADAGLDRLSRSLPADPDIDDVERRARQRRIADERELRIGLLRAMADVLKAVSDPGVDAPRRDELLRRGSAALEALAGRLEGGIADRAAAWSGVAAVRLGERDRALTLFQGVLADPAVHPADRFAAEVGRALAGGGSSRDRLARLRALEQRYAEPAHLFYRLLLADAQLLLILDPTIDGPPQPTRLNEAAASYERIISAGDPVHQASVRSAVLAKLAGAVDGRTPASDLPPLMVLARAETLAGDGRYVEAIEAYAPLAAARTDPAVRPAALLGLGRCLYESGRADEAADRWAELARDHPADPLAERAIELAASVATARWHGAPGDASRRGRLRQVLDLLLERYPNLASLDRWRLAAGQLAVDEGRLDDAVRHFDAVSPAAPERRDAEYLALLAARDRWAAARPDERAALGSALLEQARRVEVALGRTPATGSDPADEAGRRAQAARVRTIAGEALLGLGRPAEVREALGPVGALPDLPLPVVADDLQLRLRAGRDSGQVSLVTADLRRLAAAAPDRTVDLVALLVRQVQRDVDGMLAESRLEAADERAGEELAPLAGLLAELVAAAPASVRTPTLLLTLADAQLGSGRPAEALPLYDELLAESPDALPYLLGRAECLQRIGGDRLADAIVIFKRIAAAGPEVGGDAYWQSQLRTLQILDRVDRNTRRIVPQIERLRRIDPGLGGERWRRQFEALERKHG